MTAPRTRTTVTTVTTVTANPSLDRTVHVARLSRGAVHRATSELTEPSGKGVNVAVALHRAGRPTTAVLPAGGSTGQRLVDLLAGLGVSVRTVPIAGELRSNISVIEDDGTTTKVNAPGPTLCAADVTALVAAAYAASAAGQWVAWCGSLPRGFSDDDLARAVATSRAAGRRVALDTSGSALAGVLRRPAHELPHVIKPNAEELADLVGHRLSTIGEVADAAAGLVARGVETVLVSLGPDGAVLVESDLALYGQVPVARVVNTAGAGDAFLAGYLAAVDRAPEERLLSALRFGAAAVQQAGTLLDPVLLDPAVPVVPDRPGRPISGETVPLETVPVETVRDRPITSA